MQDESRSPTCGRLRGRLITVFQPHLHIDIRSNIQIKSKLITGCLRLAPRFNLALLVCNLLNITTLTIIIESHSYWLFERQLRKNNNKKVNSRAILTGQDN